MPKGPRILKASPLTPFEQRVVSAFARDLARVETGLSLAYGRRPTVDEIIAALRKSHPTRSTRSTKR